jgi:hypothetical protein
MRPRIEQYFFEEATEAEVSAIFNDKFQEK